MFKESILSYQGSLKKSIKTGWTPGWIAGLTVIAVGVFAVLYAFEADAAALLMRLVPPTYRQGSAFYTDMVFLARTELLWVACFFVVTLLLYRYPFGGALERARHFGEEGNTWGLILLIVSVFLLAVGISLFVLESFPNSSDEYAYLLQAEMFSDGKWWVRAHDLPAFFQANNIPQHEGILLSRFPPGWPLLLSLAFDAGISPMLVNPFLGMCALLVLYFFAKKYYSHQVAVWSVTIVALSSYFLFNAASFFSHISCTLFVLLFAYSVYVYRDNRNVVAAILAGFFLGMVMIIRYYTAVLIFMPFGVVLLIQYRWAALRLFFFMALGSVPCIAYLLWYNYSITGDALLPVTMWAYPLEGLGFVRGHTFLKAVEHVVRRMLMFVYWTSPGLLLLYAFFLWRKVTRPAERLRHPGDYTFLALVVGYFFYYQIGGNQYGPRFMFEAFPFLVLFVVHQAFEMRAKWVMAVLVACVIYPALKFPFISQREGMIVDQRQDLYDLVKEKNLTHAVVLVCSPTSPWRPMPAEDLTRNDPMFTGNVIYALPHPEISDQIMSYYPDRAFYRYVRNLNSPRGELIRIR